MKKQCLYLREVRGYCASWRWMKGISQNDVRSSTVSVSSRSKGGKGGGGGEDTRRCVMTKHVPCYVKTQRVSIGRLHC